MSDRPEHPACPARPSATLQTAINKFNAGDYYACHEILEALWLDEDDRFRDLYKGILQIGIGLLHLQRGNSKGARNLLRRGRELIADFGPTCFGLDLLALQHDSGAILLRLDDPDRPNAFLNEDAIQILSA